MNCKRCHTCMPAPTPRGAALFLDLCAPCASSLFSPPLPIRPSTAADPAARAAAWEEVGSPHRISFLDRLRLQARRFARE